MGYPDGVGHHLVKVADALGAGAGLVLDSLERLQPGAVSAAVPVGVLHLNLGLLFT